MKKFDFSRYLLVCRKQFVEDWRRQVGFTAVMAILLFFIFWIVNWQINMMTAMDETNSAVSEGSVVFFSWYKIIMFVAVTILAIAYQSAHSMPFMKTKTSQIAHVVLPATTMEKYFAAETFAFVFSVIEAVIAFFIADALQYALTGHFTLAEVSSTSLIEVLRNSGMTIDSDYSVIISLSVCVIVASLFFHSAWFTFCATLFRKHPFLFGMLILWGANQVLSIFVSTVSFNFLSLIITPLENMTHAETILYFKEILYGLIFGQLAVAIGFWIWSYSRMKKVEL